MAEKPIKAPLPADLPEDWNAGQIVAPDGTSVGLTEKHGYNYLMAAVNRAQRGVNAVNDFFEDMVLPIENGGTGVTSMEELKAMFGSGELGRYILTGSYSGHLSEGETETLYFKPDTETGGEATQNALHAKYGQIVLCSIEIDGNGTSCFANVFLANQQDKQEFWVSSDAQRKSALRMPLVSYSHDKFINSYSTIVMDQKMQQTISGDRLQINAQTGEFDYRVEMLFLMPDIACLGTGGSGGSTPATVQQATPTVTVNADGTVTATATQAAGYVAAGTRSATHQLSSADDTDLKPENIKDGVSIFGVQGTLQSEGGGTAGVSSFNGRSGAVVPGSGDYTAAMVGAIPAESVKTVQVLTEAEYNALTNKSATTLYLIKE